MSRKILFRGQTRRNGEKLKNGKLYSKSGHTKQ